jgi:nicotinamidase/pyrazinamidase
LHPDRFGPILNFAVGQGPVGWYLVLHFERGDAVELSNTDALIVVDVQNDFCPGGSLAVPTGDKVASAMAKAAKDFTDRGAMVFATQDWHPPGHSSFSEKGGPWPPHCVQGTSGAEFHPNLQLPESTHVVRKGSSHDKDAYSGFIDSDLEEQLRAADIRRIFVGGLATDYCVLNTVVDAVSLGFETYVLGDAVGSVDVEPGDGRRALHLMEGSGATITTLTAVLAE